MVSGEFLSVAGFGGRKILIKIMCFQKSPLYTQFLSQQSNKLNRQKT